MIWFILTADAPPPSAYTHDPRALFSFEDYPADAIARAESGTAVARILIDDKGKVDSCWIIHSTRSKSLDRATCRVIEERARFKPALNDGGRPIYSVMLTPPITWFLSDNPPTTTVKILPDADIGISQAPEGVMLPIDISVTYVVTVDGEITSCEASSPSESPQLVRIACDPAYLPKPLVMKDTSGKPVDALYTSRAHFTLGTP